MNFRRGHTREEPEINLIPMIDVLLVILIFLMVTTSYSNFAQLQINLPQAAGEQDAATAGKPINVAVDASDHYAVNNVRAPFNGVADFSDGAAQGRRRTGRPDHHHQRRCQGNAPVRHQHHGSGAHRGLRTHHLHHAESAKTSNFPTWSGCNTTGIASRRFTCCCSPLSLIFRALACATPRFLYRSGILASVKLPVPVVVVGNISVGGTGKTPLTLWLAQQLIENGWHPGIVSRGYTKTKVRQKTPREVSFDDAADVVGDEPLLMAQRALCPVWIGRDRPAAATGLAAGTSRVRHHPERRRFAALPFAARCRDRRHRRCAPLWQWAVAARGTVARTRVAAAPGRCGCGQWRTGRRWRICHEPERFAVLQLAQSRNDSDRRRIRGTTLACHRGHRSSAALLCAPRASRADRATPCLPRPSSLLCGRYRL